MFLTHKLIFHKRWLVGCVNSPEVFIATEGDQVQFSESSVDVGDVHGNNDGQDLYDEPH